MIEGIRSPLILAATMTFIHISQHRFQWIFMAYLLVSAIIFSLGHWFTLKSENKSSTGEALLREKQLLQHLDIKLSDDAELHRKPEFVIDKLRPSLRVGVFFLAGGFLVLLPFLLLKPMEKGLLAAMIISIPVLIMCSVTKARYYNVSVPMEIVRTSLLTFLTIGLIYGIIRLIV